MNPDQRLVQTVFFREIQAEQQEILRHKWLESEKAGYDIGWERARVDWVVRYRHLWRRSRGQSGCDR